MKRVCWRVKLAAVLLSGLSVMSAAGDEPKKVKSGEPRTLEWTDLLTEEDRQRMANLPEIEHLGEEVLLAPGQISLNPPQVSNALDSNALDSGGVMEGILDGIEAQEGSTTDTLDGNPLDMKPRDWRTDMERSAAEQWTAVLTATTTVAALNNTEVRISGFIVPLEFDGDMVVTEFFLVPYYGACIHVPPPPPNQLIHVTLKEGIVLDAIYDPFWVSGLLTTEGKLNDIGYAAYSLKANNIEDYYPTVDE